MSGWRMSWADYTSYDIRTGQQEHEKKLPKPKTIIRDFATEREARRELASLKRTNPHIVGCVSRIPEPQVKARTKAGATHEEFDALGWHREGPRMSA